MPSVLEIIKLKYMTKVDFTNWLHSELDAVFHGDITPEQVMLNAIPMIDTIFSQNSGKPIVSGSLPQSESPIEFIERRFVTADGVIEWNDQVKGYLSQKLGGNDR